MSSVRRQLLGAVAGLGALGLLVAGCSSSGEASSAVSSSSGSSTIAVTASTNVWGSVAEEIGGDAVEVTSLITSSSQDPHEFEATAHNQLEVADAQVVVENGGGYDAFIQTMLDASDSDPAVIDAAQLSGKMPAGADESDEIEGFNEHVWYDFPTAKAVAKELADAFAEIDPANASTFQENYESFSDTLDGLTSRLTAISTEHSGAGVAITEPVPLYMLDAAGLENKTPSDFSEAVEEGTDVSASVLQETLDLFSNHEVVLLAYNAQTETSQTDQVVDAAQSADIPAIGFTETLPDGTSDYLQWMTDNVSSLETALE